MGKIPGKTSRLFDGFVGVKNSLKWKIIASVTRWKGFKYYLRFSLYQIAGFFHKSKYGYGFFFFFFFFWSFGLPYISKFASNPSRSDCIGTQSYNHLVNEHSTIYPNYASLAKWLSVRLRTKCVWVWIPLQTRNLQISRLFRARSSLTFRQLQSIDSF